MYQDKTLVCRDCGQEFVFTAGEQEFFAEKGFLNDPVRCRECRAAKKNAHREKVSYRTVCAKCGAETEVPFIPKNDKPVFILQQPSPFKFKVTVTSVSAVFLQIRTFRLPDIINRVISRQESVCNTTGKSVSRHSPSQIPFIPI